MKLEIYEEIMVPINVPIGKYCIKWDSPGTRCSWIKEYDHDGHCEIFILGFRPALKRVKVDRFKDTFEKCEQCLNAEKIKK